MNSFKKSLSYAASAVLCLGVFNCDGTGSGSRPIDEDPISHLYSRSTIQVRVDVAYQTGAEPYTGNLIAMDVWTLFETNANRLFNNQKNITIPTTLDQMQNLTGVSGSSFTTQQILNIAEANRSSADNEIQSSFYVLFLKGYFNDGQQVRSDVLGVSIGDTEVIAMFKPVISQSSGQPGIRKFVEQSTLIHEFGHAVGLVNNGVNMVTPHQDTAHGAHDQNDQCVMYYANEGAAAATAFASKYLQTGDEILFDSNCLADTAARLNTAK